MDTEFFSPKELSDLTSESKQADQIKALEAMGIPYLVNPRGKLKVSRHQTRARAMGVAVTPTKRPNMAAAV